VIAEDEWKAILFLLLAIALLIVSLWVAEPTLFG